MFRKNIILLPAIFAPACILLFYLLIIPLYAEGEAKDYKYSVKDNGIIIESYLGTAAELTIPDTIGGIPVTYIGSDTFKNNATLKKLTLPQSIKDIGFNYSDGSTGETWCRSLTEINIPAGNEKFISADGILYYKDLSAIALYPAAKNLTGYTCRDGIKNIAQNTFYNNKYLVKLTFPSGLQTIGKNACYGCGELAEISLPDTLKEIGARTFMGCTKLKSITIPDGVSLIGSEAFRNCESLIDIYIPYNIGDTEKINMLIYALSDIKKADILATLHTKDGAQYQIMNDYTVKQSAPAMPSASSSASASSSGTTASSDVIKTIDRQSLESTKRVQISSPVLDPAASNAKAVNKRGDQTIATVNVPNPAGVNNQTDIKTADDKTPVSDLNEASAKGNGETKSGAVSNSYAADYQSGFIKKYKYSGLLVYTVVAVIICASLSIAGIYMYVKVKMK